MESAEDLSLQAGASRADTKLSKPKRSGTRELVPPPTEPQLAPSPPALASALSVKRILWGGLAMALVGVADGPRHLYVLLSSDGALRASTVAEAEVERFGLLALSVLVIVGALLWRSQKAAPLRSMLNSDFSRFVAEGAPRPRFGIRLEIWTWQLLLVALVGSLVTAMHSFHPETCETRLYKYIAQESGLWETFTAVNWLVAGVLTGRVVWSLRRAGGRGTVVRLIVPGIIALGFIAVAGEEVSWGQHWLGFATPKALTTVNVQDEFNLHNLGGYWANQLSMILMLGYGALLPLTTRYSVDIAYGVDRLAVPVAPMASVPFGIIGFLLDERPSFARLWGSPPYRLSEVRELILSAVALASAFAFAAWSAQRIRDRRQSES